MMKKPPTPDVHQAEALLLGQIFAAWEVPGYKLNGDAAPSMREGATIPPRKPAVRSQASAASPRPISTAPEEHAMPIRPDLRHLYLTPEWASTRNRILKRARGRCEQCHKPMNCSIYTYTWQTWETIDGIGRLRVYHMVWARVRQAQPGAISLAASCPAIAGRRRACRGGSASSSESPTSIPPASSMPTRISSLLCTWCHLHQDSPQHKVARSMRKDRGRPILARSTWRE